jgi:hypothetical protein
VIKDIKEEVLADCEVEPEEDIDIDTDQGKDNT